MERMAYFNNAATTFPKPEEVYQFVDKFYRESGVNSGRGQIDSSGRLIHETRELMLDLFHCPHKKVIFTPSATEALNLILQGLPIENNFNVYVSPFEHNAVIRVLKYLQETYKLNIISLFVDEINFIYDIEKIKYQFSENRPHIVIKSHASNVCGIVAPIKDICSMSHHYGAINIIDMCQTAGLIDTDLSSEIYDFTVFDGHKTLYATFGIAGFICSGSIKPKPLLYGGTGVDSANPNLPDTIPERYEVGSQNIMAIAGLYAAVNWIKNTNIEVIRKKEQENRRKLLEILSKFANIRVIANITNSDTVGVVSCIFDNYSSDNIGQILMEHNIEVRTGLHCSPEAHKYLGTFPAGTVRFSVSYFNTDEDFQQLENALLYIYENS
jgi:cysteine desulfurase family protein